MSLSSSKACPAISEMKYLNATFAELLCNTLQRKMNVEIVSVINFLGKGFSFKASEL